MLKTIWNPYNPYGGGWTSKTSHPPSKTAFHHHLRLALGGGASFSIWNRRRHIGRRPSTVFNNTLKNACNIRAPTDICTNSSTYARILLFSHVPQEPPKAAAAGNALGAAERSTDAEGGRHYADAHLSAIAE